MTCINTQNSRLLLLLALALAFFISSSIFLFKCSSFLSNINNCDLNPTIASLAFPLLSFLPVNADINDNELFFFIFFLNLNPNRLSNSSMMTSLWPIVYLYFYYIVYDLRLTQLTTPPVRS